MVFMINYFKLMMHRRFEDLFSVSFLLAITLAFRIPFLILNGTDVFNADHAVLGLMGRHILEGKWMVYYYGQGYMGSIEAFVAAFLFALAKPDVMTLQSAPLLFFCVFIVVNYFLLARIFNRKISFFSNFILACGSPVLSVLSITALGGYPEILFFASAALLCWLIAEEKKSIWLMGFAGFLAGIGVWTNFLIMVYVISFFVMACFQNGWLKPSSIFNFLWVRHEKIPRVLRWALRIGHFFIGYYILINLVGVLTGLRSFEWGPVHWDIPSPPFQMKKIKKVVLFFALEGVFISFFYYGVAFFIERLKKYSPLAVGFLLGYAPALGFTLFGGEGYRVLHSSGISYLNQWPEKMMTIVNIGFLRGILGAPLVFLEKYQGMALIAAIFFFVFQIALLAASFFQARKIKNPWVIYPAVIILVNVGICFLSTLQADRYLMPCYFAISLMTAFAVYGAFKRSRIAAVVILIILAAQSIFAHSLYRPVSTDLFFQGTKRLMARLEQEGIRGGYADYWKAYPFNFLAAEKIIFAPYLSPDRYPAYTKQVQALPRVAYVFEETDPQFHGIEPKLIADGKLFDKYFEAPFWVFIADQRSADAVVAPASE